MKKKLLIFSLIFVVLIITLFICYFKNENGNKKDIKVNNNSINEKIDKNDNNTLEDEKDIVIDENIPITNENEPKKEIITENDKEIPKKESSDISSSLNEEDNTSKKDVVIPELPKEETPKVDTPKEEPKQELKEWEKMGISEYDYYNKPMWSWMKISFKLEDYGSQAATENACREYGNKKAEEESLGFSCTNVLSYSGKYLGEYIKFF